MEVVNPFILKNKIGMVKFIDELCNVDPTEPITHDKSSADDNNNDNGGYIEEENQNPARDLATVHNICESYRSELEQSASSFQSVKKLVTTLTILSKHKQYYTNLRRNTQNMNTQVV